MTRFFQLHLRAFISQVKPTSTWRIAGSLSPPANKWWSTKSHSSAPRQSSRFTRWLAQPYTCSHVPVSRTGRQCAVTYQNRWQHNNPPLRVDVLSVGVSLLLLSPPNGERVWGHGSHLKTAGTVIRFFMICSAVCRFVSLASKLHSPFRVQSDFSFTTRMCSQIHGL